MGLLSQLNAGQRVTAAMLRAIAPVSAYKTADEPVSSETLQNDDTLALQLPANSTFFWVMVFHYSGGTQGSSDLKVAWSVPSSASMRYTRIGLTTAGAADVGGFANESTVLTFGTSGTGTRSVLMAGTASTVGTPGNMQLRWCQNAGTITATTVKAGSALAGWQIA